MSPIPFIGGLFPNSNANVQRQQTKKHDHSQSNSLNGNNQSERQITHARKVSEMGISDSEIAMVDAWTRSKAIDIPSNLMSKQNKKDGLNFFA